MKKSICFLVIMVFCLTLLPVVMAADHSIVDKDYFDQRFNELERASAEIKGDTSQIVSILGNVFEGTVPSGGTLIGLCNQYGWNLIVLMGHNNVVNPNVVSAGDKFTYPQTADEFQQALAKGKPLYDAWLKKQKTTFRVNRIKVDTADIDTLNVRVATFKEKLSIKEMEIDQLKIREAEITERLKIKELEIEKLRVENAEIDKLRIHKLEVDNLRELLREAGVCISNLESRLQSEKSRADRLASQPAPLVYVNDPTDACSSCSDCDERPFSGNVSEAVLRMFPAGADALELQERPNSKLRFKAKRLRIGANGVAVPMVWLGDGSCMRTYSEFDLTQDQLQGLVAPDENLIRIDNYKDGDGGQHKTIAVYAIVKR